MPTKVRLLYLLPIVALTAVGIVFELWLTVFIGIGLTVWLLVGALRGRERPPSPPRL